MSDTLYFSTNLNTEKVSFSQALLKGLAPDGGLYMPVDIPQISKEEIISFKKLPYHEIAYHIFPDKPITDFQSIVLRNSGNDWNYTMFRDGFMTGLLEDRDLDIQSYRPAIVYLNGEYWGIQNIREKVNEHFIASNNNVDSENIDLLENNGVPIHGDAEHYNSMITYLEKNDMTDTERTWIHR